MKVKQLDALFELIVTEYIRKFEKKHDLQFDHWIGDHIGELAVFGDFFFSFSDIKYDISNEIKGDTIIEWYDHTLEHGIHINYHSYCK